MVPSLLSELLIVNDGHLMVEWIDGDVECRVVPLHLLPVFHVHLHRALLRRADTSDAEYYEEHKEPNADNGNHRHSGACHVQSRVVQSSAFSTTLLKLTVTMLSAT